MSVTVNSRFQLNINETITAGVPALASNDTLIQNAFTHAHTLDASSTPVASNAIALTPTLVAGALTIDMTSLTAPGGATFDATGLKLQELIFNNGTTTGNVLAGGSNSVVSIDEGATNGYALFGASGGPVKVHPGGSIHYYAPEVLDDVGASDLAIDLAGTGTDAFEMILIFG